MSLGKEGEDVTNVLDEYILLTNHKIVLLYWFYLHLVEDDLSYTKREVIWRIK